MKFHSILCKSLALLLAAGMMMSAGCGTKNDTKEDTSSSQEGENVVQEEEKVEEEQPAESETQEQDAETAETIKIKIGATPSPHAVMLEGIVDELKAQGIELEIVQFTDYIQPNLALADGDLDANFFQHIPYLENFNVENGTDLVSAANIHYEPMGLFPSKTSTIEELQEGAVIAIPNDTTNEARALQLLQQNGLITITEGVGLNATVLDIVDNPKQLKFEEIEAAQVPRILPDVDMAVINGNFALDAGLNVFEDAIAMEDASSEASQTFPNVIAVRNGDENREEIKKLIEVLKGESSNKFIEETFKGAVVPVS